jgi:hypothetical protein
MRAHRATLAAALALAAWGSLTGSICVAAYCSEGECDPCRQNCKCDKHCENALAPDFETAHRIDARAIVIEPGEHGPATRVLTGIVGLSLDRALGVREHDARDLEVFTRNVIRANAALFGAPEAWELVAVERVSGGAAVTHAAVAGEEALVFLLDRQGNLLEVARHLKAH